jgi:hypothetical protein
MFERQPSYFTNCKQCGVKIHLRQMAHEQWVAFDNKTRVHQCGQQSAYDELASLRHRKTTSTKQDISSSKNTQLRAKSPAAREVEFVKKTNKRTFSELLRSPGEWPNLVLIAMLLMLLRLTILFSSVVKLALDYWWVSLTIIAIFYSAK